MNKEKKRSCRLKKLLLDNLETCSLKKAFENLNQNKSRLQCIGIIAYHCT